MVGKKQTDKCRAAVSASSKAMWGRDKAVGAGLMSEEARQRRSDNMARRQAEPESSLRRGYSRGSQGRRADFGGLFFRSSWEANYARYLNYLVSIGKICRWEFEPDTFWFEAIRRGVRSYLPDFKVWNTPGADPYYVEVKGWMDAKSKTKLKRMAKYYPHVRVDVVGANAYKILCARHGNLPFWERPGKARPAAEVEDPASPILPDWLTGS
jgi:hypothetical protein